VIVGFYTPIEIGAAKKLLVNTFSGVLADCSLKAERRKSSARELHEVEVDDILGMFNYLDANSKLDTVIFAAVNHERIPKYGPEELNLCALADGQSKLKSYVNETVDSLSTQISHLTSLCTQFTETFKGSHTHFTSSSPKVQPLAQLRQVILPLQITLIDREM